MNSRRGSWFFLCVVPAFAILAAVTASAAATEKILLNFNPYPHGDQPSGGLGADTAGNLYGVTEFGGSIGYGAVYKLSPNSHGGWSQTVIYSFPANSAANPGGSVVLDSAGNLYGIGNSGAGSIFKLTSSANGQWTSSTIWTGYAENGLIFDSAGNLYGATSGGGTGRCGTVFRLAPTANGPWKQTVLYSFGCGIDGSGPNGGVIFDQSGNLYGATAAGGTAGYGVVYELTESAGVWTEQALYSFLAGSGGYSPAGPLVFDSKGDLFGAAAGGQSTACFRSACGLIFELTANSGGQWTETVAHDFMETDGDSPVGGLVIDQNGNLYGSTVSGGTAPNPEGTVFELTPASGGSWTDKTLWNFTGGKDGALLEYGVILGAAGKLYGTTKYDGGLNGNGTVFQLTPTESGPWKETTLSNLLDGNGGPTTGLTADGAGNFYGATDSGGANGFGMIYELSPKSGGGWKITILYNFPTGLISDGQAFGTSPSNLIFDSAGNLYGETGYGGAANNGSVYKLSPAAGGTWVEKDLYDFSGGADGSMPIGGLIFDAAGNLYGNTRNGGSSTACNELGCGTVFELTPSGAGWSKTILYNLQGGTTDGAHPEGGVVFDKAGNLYDATFFGGPNGTCGRAGCGSVFEISPSAGTWKETFVYIFTGKQGNGSSPASGLIFDSTGNVYGTTTNGGVGGGGIAFEFSPVAGGGWKETVIFSFTGDSGYGPNSPLIFDSAGDLFGATESSVFELSPAAGGTWSETTLYQFKGTGGDGSDALGGLVLDGAGNLYGTTANGGSSNGGIVYEIIP
jgi:uncharacterized repeat protein (TIGR03803 family)